MHMSGAVCYRVAVPPDRVQLGAQLLVLSPQIEDSTSLGDEVLGHRAERSADTAPPQ